MSVHIDRPLFGREVLSAYFFHRLDDRLRPCRHAQMKSASWLGHRVGSRAIDVAVAGVDFHLILIRANRLTLEPDRRSYSSVGMEGIVRPVATNVIEVEAARISHRAHLKATLAA